ncbi:MAG: hypothetical protein ACLFN5_03835, partial [bacterium]
FFEEKTARGLTFRRVSVLVFAIGIITLFLTVTTVYERQAMQIQYEVLQTARDSGVEVIDYSFKYRTNWIFRQPDELILTVSSLKPAQKNRLRETIEKNYPDLKITTVYQSIERIK